MPSGEGERSSTVRATSSARRSPTPSSPRSGSTSTRARSDSRGCSACSQPGASQRQHSTIAVNRRHDLGSERGASRGRSARHALRRISRPRPREGPRPRPRRHPNRRRRYCSTGTTTKRTPSASRPSANSGSADPEPRSPGAGGTLLLGAALVPAAFERMNMPSVPCARSRLRIEAVRLLRVV